uniref:Uncharacterized protein n=1 Tax=Chromera velia CCMP2878 TaxID=1169474 RepID=A0A0G4HE54_9ALVE|eukprot:Cvel_26636.t1-p1 / transcript=Cvel_26636.t1 / gene=Cvel_26636 / organism=Chromera_velia_CCMP2878 / gene_product=hypothetical protein / transcript_product=hypothetical protein / location=Cvel_scaffold3201:693-13776(+) / protein_length=579 / sequence_SO=supercontig / SO=protein_coding / is_pseudo=false
MQQQVPATRLSEEVHTEKAKPPGFTKNWNWVYIFLAASALYPLLVTLVSYYAYSKITPQYGGSMRMHVSYTGAHGNWFYERTWERALYYAWSSVVEAEGFKAKTYLNNAEFPELIQDDGYYNVTVYTLALGEEDGKEISRFLEDVYSDNSTYNAFLDEFSTQMQNLADEFGGPVPTLVAFIPSDIRGEPGIVNQTADNATFLEDPSTSASTTKVFTGIQWFWSASSNTTCDATCTSYEDCLCNSTVLQAVTSSSNVCATIDLANENADNGYGDRKTCNTFTESLQSYAPYRESGSTTAEMREKQVAFQRRGPGRLPEGTVLPAPLPGAVKMTEDQLKKFRKKREREQVDTKLKEAEGVGGAAFSEASGTMDSSDQRLAGLLNVHPSRRRRGAGFRPSPSFEGSEVSSVASSSSSFLLGSSSVSSQPSSRASSLESVNRLPPFAFEGFPFEGFPFHPTPPLHILILRPPPIVCRPVEQQPGIPSDGLSAASNRFSRAVTRQMYEAIQVAEGRTGGAEAEAHAEAHAEAEAEEEEEKETEAEEEEEEEEEEEDEEEGEEEEKEEEDDTATGGGRRLEGEPA